MEPQQQPISQNQSIEQALNAAPPVVPGQGSVMAVAKKAPIGAKKKPANQSMFSWIAGGMLNKDTIFLGTIVILILIILGMSIFVIQSITTPGVTVVFEREESTSTSQTSTNQSDQSSTVGQDTNQTPVATQITQDFTIMMIAFEDENPNAVYPVGTEELSIDGVYLVPVAVKEVLEGDELTVAINLLFGQEDVIYRGVSLRNYWTLSDMSSEIAETEIGARVELDGEVVIPGDLAGVYLKAQLEGTLEEYTSDFVIVLNGSESNYRCLNDLSGLCS